MHIIIARKMLHHFSLKVLVPERIGLAGMCGQIIAVPAGQADCTITNTSRLLRHHVRPSEQQGGMLHTTVPSILDHALRMLDEEDTEEEQEDNEEPKRQSKLNTKTPGGAPGVESDLRRFGAEADRV